MSRPVVLLNEDLSALAPEALERARRLADWIVANQTPDEDYLADAGNFPFVVSADGVPRAANNWNHAFAIMGLLAAGRVFGEERYTQAALRMGRKPWIELIPVPFLSGYQEMPSRSTR